MGEATLGSLAAAGVLELNDGYRTKQAELGFPGTPILRVAEVLDGRIAPSLTDYVSEAFRPKFERKTSRSGDVVVTTKGTVGRVARIGVDREFVYSPQVCFIRVVDGTLLDREWLYQWFRGPEFRRQALSVQDQTDMAAYINLVDLRATTITVPALSEQRAIAEVLGALDDKIEANRWGAFKAEGLAVAVACAVARSTAVGEVAAQSRRLVSTTFFADQQVEYFSLPAFDAGRLPLVQDGDRIKSGKFLLERSAVLVSKLNPHIPRVWMAAPTGRTLAITSTEFVGLVPAANYPVEVLWALCASVEFTSQLAEMVKGTTGSHQRVSAEDMLAREIPDPRALAADATETVTAAVRLAGGLREESARLASLRDTLLPRLMSGELRVRDADLVVGEAV